MKHRVSIIIGIVVLIAVVSASLGVAIYYYQQYHMLASDSQKAEDTQTQAMLSKISTVMELPVGKPSIVTVTDREKLQGQEFFKKALNGDKIIIYESAKRVILYRPSVGKVIDVAPLVFNTPGADGIAPGEPQQTTPGSVQGMQEESVSQEFPPVTETPQSTDSAVAAP